MVFRFSLLLFFSRVIRNLKVYVRRQVWGYMLNSDTVRCRIIRSAMDGIGYN